MTPRRTRVAVVCAVVLGAAVPFPAAAQSKADAFAGKIPPVSGQLFRKTGRLEVTALFAPSLNDAFFTKYFGGAKLGYHVTESLSAAAYAAGGIATQSGSAVRCTALGGCTDATEVMLRQVPGRIRSIFGAEAAWSPIYGKLNVVSEQVAHFDLSIMAGPDIVAYDKVLSMSDAEAGVTPSMATTLGAHVGLGARVFLTQALAVHLEVKDYVYGVKVPNNPELGTDVQNQLFAELGVSLFLPLHNRPVR